jgi:hypothetical protein
MTTNGLANGTNNCMNMPANTVSTTEYWHGLFRWFGQAYSTGAAKVGYWTGGFFSIDITPGTPPTIAVNNVTGAGTPTYSTGTITGMSLAITADGTNFCPAVTFTRPTGASSEQWNGEFYAEQLVGG